MIRQNIFTTFPAVTLLLGASGMFAPDYAQTSVAWSPSIHLESIHEIDHAMSETEPYPLELLRNEERRTVRNCISYLSAVRNGFVPGGNSQQALAGNYIERCFSLEFLKQANAEHGRLISGWPSGMVSSLPPLMCPGECGGKKRTKWQETFDAGSPWKEWDPTIRTESTHASVAILQDAIGWTFAVSLLVESSSQIKQGNSPAAQRFGILACASRRSTTYHECRFIVLESNGSRLHPIEQRP